MDDPVPVRGGRPDSVDETGKKHWNWRGRMALAVLVVTILIGYVVMFLAFDLWYKG